jgi:hypothetical protein
MSQHVVSKLRFPCRSGACLVRGLALLVLWIALVAGFLAQTTMAASVPQGSHPQTAAECPAHPATTS